MEEKEIITSVFYRKELFVKAILYILGCALLGIASTYWLKSIVISVICLIGMIGPVFFIGLIKRKFTRKIIFGIDRQQVKTTITDSDGKEEKGEINLEEVESYSVQIPNDRFTSIKFNLRNGGSVEYSFFQKKQANDSITAEDLIDFFNQLIKAYNSASNKNKIELRPSFYATKAGLYCIVGLCVLLGVGLFLASFVKGKALPLSFLFAVILILQLMLKRKSELDYYKKMQ
jgi:hypothetical protein